MTMRVFAGVMLAMLLFVPLGCSQKGRATGPVDRYELEGVVVRVDSKAKSATIKHEDIKNVQGKVWMAAMTMEFPVKEQADFAKLKEGILIKAALFQRPADFEYWIAEVTVLP